MQNKIIPLSYLLGIADDVCEHRFGDKYKPEEYAKVPWAHKIRAMMRTRQTVIYSIYGGKKFYSLTDPLRSYCPKGFFDEMQKMLSSCGNAPDFVNKLTSLIDEHVEDAMKGLDIPHGEALRKTLFLWPKHAKKSLTDFSTMYMSKKRKYTFPYKVFIPKPGTFGSSLYGLLESDENLWDAPPIRVAISQEKSVCEPPKEHEEPVSITAGAVMAATTDSRYTNAHYIQTAFYPSQLPVLAGNVISYVDFDNTPEHLVAQLCAQSSVARRVKIFYDDRASKDITLFQGFAYVEPIFVPRLKCQKSLVDTAIAVNVMKDLYDAPMTSAVLYSSDSDFFPLTAAFNERGKKLIVVTLEDNVADDYVDALSESADTYVLSQQAITPVIDKNVVLRLLTNLVNSESIRTLNVKGVVNSILAAISAPEFHHLLTKDVTDIVVELLQNAKIELIGDKMRIVLGSADSQPEIAQKEICAVKPF